VGLPRCWPFKAGASSGAFLRVNETLIKAPLQSYSIVALVQERAYRDHYRIAASAIVRAKYTVIFVAAGQTPLAIWTGDRRRKILKRTSVRWLASQVIGRNRNRPDNSANPISRKHAGGSEAAY
jgi:hypothetical protein